MDSSLPQAAPSLPQAAPSVRVRKPYPSDVSDEEWHFVAPYLTLSPQDAGQRKYPLRDVFTALGWLVRTGHGAALWQGGDLTLWMVRNGR